MATMTLSDMTFQNYTSKVAILITTSGTYTLDNCTFDGSGTYEIEIDSGVTGDTTIILQNGTTALTAGDIDNNGSGSVTIQNNVTLTVTVKDESGSNIENARVLLEADSGGALPSYDTVTITRVTTTATVSHTAHGLATNDYVCIRDANQEEYNGVHQITVTTANAYTFTVSGSPTTPATGTITSTFVMIWELTNASGIATETFNYTASQPVQGWVRKMSGSPYLKEGSLSGSIGSGGYDVNLVLISDE